MTEWRSSTWGDEISLEYGKSLRDYAGASGPVRVYGSNGPIGYTDKALSEGPGVILGRKGAYRGAEYSKGRFFVIDTAYYVVPKTALDMRWIYYAIQHHKLGEIDDGSPIPSTTRSAVYVRDLDVPDIAEQKTIAAILGALDDKIELNRRMNATLEAMARALFKSWFIDFDPVRAKSEGLQPFGMDAETAALFPSRLVSSALGDIPEGWAPSNLVAEFDIIMGQSPPGETYNEIGDGLPFYQGRTDFGSRYPSRRIFCTQPNRVAEIGDTLISVRAPVGDINMAFEKCILGRGVAALRHKSKARGYTYYALHSVQPDLKAFEADGTVFGSVNKQDLGKIKFIQAPDGLVKKFEAVADDIDAKILALTIESERLEKTRDYLLPKLISGDICIRDAEKFVEAA